MRKTPSTTTLKKLFALSGNLCAFRNCKVNLVDKDENLVGQICHIEAAEKGGERYNSKQTDTERASFKNLVILCANHHLVTNDENTYTVTYLQQMKLEHEQRFISSEYQVNDSLIEQAKRQLQTQKNVNSGPGSQENYQAGYMVVHQGMSSTDVVSLVKELFNANFPTLMAAARDEATRNIAAFESQFKEEVSKKLSPDELSKFSDPDIQVALNEAVLAAARKNSPQLRQMLSDLVIRRVKNDENELKQKVLSEAIPTVPKLTSDQLKIITLCFLIKHASFVPAVPWKNFKQRIDKDLKPFLGFKGSKAEILHLQYAGCGKVDEMFSTDLAEIFRGSYSFSFSNPLTEDEISELSLSVEGKSSLLKNDGNKIYFFVSNKPEIETKLRELNIQDEKADKIIKIYESKLLSPEEIKTLIEAELPWARELFDLFQNTSFNHLTLTSVGMAIGVAFYEQQANAHLNLDIWIN